MKNKILATLLALSLTIGCLAGCGNSKENGSSAADESSKSSQTAESTVAESSTEEEKTDSNFNETGYPIVNEKVTLELYAITSITDPNEAEFWKELEELTNVHIEWTTIPADSAKERINLMFAGGEYPDAITNATAGVSNLQELAAEGIVVPLNDLIDKYMPNLKERTTDELAQITYTDGNIYYFPMITDYYWMHSVQAVYINQEWLDNLGLDMPTTIDEFTEVLRAFKEKDANGNGDPDDEIPYSALNWDWKYMFSMITGAFGYPWGDLLVDDGTVVDPRVEESSKEAIKYLRMLYTEGLIDQEIFTQDQNAQLAKTKMETPIVGVCAGWRKHHSFGNENGEQYVNIMPIAGADGQRGIQSASTKKKISNYMVVTNACEYPEVLARWVDTLYDMETSAEVNKGPVGVTMTITEGGLYEIHDPIGYSINWSDYITTVHYDRVPHIVPTVSDNFFLQKEVVGNDKDAQDIMYEEDGALVPAYPKVIMTADEESEIALLATDINKYSQETICRWISGQGDIDADWDEYISTMTTFDHERFIENDQQAYDLYVANSQ